MGLGEWSGVEWMDGWIPLRLLRLLEHLAVLKSFLGEYEMNMKQNIVQSQRYSNENLRNMEICGQLVMNTLPQGVHLNSRMRKKHKSLTLWAWLGQYHIHRSYFKVSS